MIQSDTTSVASSTPAPSKIREDPNIPPFFTNTSLEEQIAAERREMTMRIMNQNGEPIATVDDWYTHAPPAKGSLQWKDGRSAKECAKAWLCTGQPMLPEDLRELLDSHPDTRGFIADIAIAECETKLDDYKGKGRNHDLILLGESSGKLTLVAIEAKVDETFGEIANEYVARRVAKNPRSKVPERVNQLSRALFGATETEAIRYQLIHAVAGTLIEAKSRGSDLAIFVIHQFESSKMDSIKALENIADFVEFMQKLTGFKLLYNSGLLFGPISIPGGGKVPSDIPLYFGYVRTPTI